MARKNNNNRKEQNRGSQPEDKNKSAVRTPAEEELRKTSGEEAADEKEDVVTVSETSDSNREEKESDDKKKSVGAKGKVKKGKVPFGVKLAKMFAPKTYLVVEKSDLEEQLRNELAQKDAELATNRENSEAELDTLKQQLFAQIDDKNVEIGQLKHENEELTTQKDEVLSRYKEICDFLVKKEIIDQDEKDVVSALDSLLFEYNELNKEKNNRENKPQDTPRSRTLQDILKSPYVDEQKILNAYLAGAFKDTIEIPNTSTNPIAGVKESLENCRKSLKKANDENAELKKSIENIRQQRDDAVNDLKEKETEEYFKTQLHKESRFAALNEWLASKLNALVEKEERRLVAETLEDNVTFLATFVNAPQSESEAIEKAQAETATAIEAGRKAAEEAVEAGRKAMEEAVESTRSELLKTIGKTVGTKIGADEEIPGAVENFVNSQIKKQVTDKINLRLPLESLIPQLNEDIALASNARKAFDEIDGKKVSTVEEYRKLLIESNVQALNNKIAEKIQKSGDEELIGQLDDGKPADAMVSKLIEVVKTRGSKINKLEKEQEDLLSENEQLRDKNEKQGAEIVKVYDSYLRVIERAVKNIGANAEKSCQAADRTEMLAEAIDKRVLSNPAGGYDDFCSDLQKAFAAIEPGDTDGVRKTIHDVVMDFQQTSRATWMDILVRLYLYSKVSFISEQFLSKETNPTDLARAVEALSELLAEGGLELYWPTLFVDHDKEGDFDYEAIRNIDSYVDDISGHVTAGNLIIDLACVGIRKDGNIVKKPRVSLFNS